MIFEAGRNGSLFVVPKKLQKDNGNREDVQRDDIIQNGNSYEPFTIETT